MIPVHPPTEAVKAFADQNYWECLHPWCVIRLMPRMQRAVIQRFRTRNQAEEYVKGLGHLSGTSSHQVVFDPIPADAP
jgi:hypothetical protein